MTIDDVRARLEAEAAGPEPWDWSREERDLRALLDDHARLAQRARAAEDTAADMLVEHAAEVVRLTRERDEARAQIDEARAQIDEAQRAVGRQVRHAEATQAERDAALSARDEARAALSVRYALAREVEALLGVPEGPAGQEQLAAGVAAVRALVADRDRLAAALAGVLAAARACVDAFDDIGVPRAECRARNEALRVVLAATPADLATARDARVRAEALREAAYIADACASAGMSAGDAAERIRAEAERIERGGR